MKVLKYNSSGKKVGEFELPESLFAQDINLNCIYESIKSENINKRFGNSKTKKRSEVSGGGKKPWAQKGTGNARQGSIRSPQWRGGGIVHGPNIRNFSSKLNKKIKRNAILSVLSLKARNQEIIILDDLSMEDYSTNKIVALMDNVLQRKKCKKKKSFIVSGENKIIKSSMRNIKNLSYVNSIRVSCMHLYYSDKIFITEKSIDDMCRLWCKEV